MIEKTLEAFFRHWVLILLPMFAIPFDVSAAMLATPAQYEAQAGMWVEQPTYLNYSTDDINRYLSPAANQRNRLVELMQTKSFLAEIVGATSLASVLAAPGGDDALRQIFARDFEAVTSGDHLLSLRFRSEDRDEAAAVLTSMVAKFKDRAINDRYAQAQVAIAFYQSRLTEAESALTGARKNLASYLAANPALAASLSRPGDTSARTDPVYAEAQRQVDALQKDADAASNSLEAAQLDVAAGLKGLELAFRLVDPVTPSATASRQLKKILIYPIVALVLGVLLSAGLLAMFALSDGSVRSLADLGPDAVVLGVLPHLRVKGAARRPGQAAIRRAIGFVAGSQIGPASDRARRAS